MPTYVFIDDRDGSVREIVDSMTSPAALCKTGDTLEVDGVALRKVPAFGGNVDVEKDWRHLAFSIDPDDPDVPHVVQVHGSRFAAFKDKREILEFQAKQRARPGNHMRMEYDFGSHG